MATVVEKLKAAEEAKAKLAEERKRLEDALVEKTKEAEEALKAKAATEAAMRAREIDLFVENAAREGHLRKRDREIVTAILLHAPDQVEKFSFGEGKEKRVEETSLRQLIQNFVLSLKQLDFSEAAAAGARPEIDEAHEVANQRAQEMLRAKGWGREKYAEALKAVFAADPDLRTAYEREQRGGV